MILHVAESGSRKAMAVDVTEPAEFLHLILAQFVGVSSITTLNFKPTTAVATDSNTQDPEDPEITDQPAETRLFFISSTIDVLLVAVNVLFTIGPELYAILILQLYQGVYSMTNCLFYVIRKVWKNGGFLITRKSNFGWWPHFIYSK